MKNKAFSLVDFLIWFGAPCLVISLFLHIAISAKKEIHKRVEIEKSLPSQTIVATESGSVNTGNRYIIFTDTSTGRRLFYFNQTIVVLPEKENK